MFFFEHFPRVDYRLSNGHSIRTTDITRRLRIRQDVLTNRYILSEYDLDDNETAEMVAQGHFGNAQLDWLVWIINSNLDPHFEWPLSSQEFDERIRRVYGSFEQARAQTHCFLRIVLPASREEGEVTKEVTVMVDEAEWQTIPAESRRRRSMLDWERSENERRRRIRLIDARFLPQILREMRNLYVA